MSDKIRTLLISNTVMQLGIVFASNYLSVGDEEMDIVLNAQQGFLKVLICPCSDHLDEERSQISRRRYEKKSQSGTL